MLNVAFYSVNMGKITKDGAARPAQTLFKKTQEHKIQQQVRRRIRILQYLVPCISGPATFFLGFHPIAFVLCSFPIASVLPLPTPLELPLSAHTSLNTRTTPTLIFSQGPHALFLPHIPRKIKSKSALHCDCAFSLNGI